MGKTISGAPMPVEFSSCARRRAVPARHLADEGLSAAWWGFGFAAVSWASVAIADPGRLCCRMESYTVLAGRPVRAGARVTMREARVGRADGACERAPQEVHEKVDRGQAEGVSLLGRIGCSLFARRSAGVQGKASSNPHKLEGQWFRT
ncbi:hypothetical protein K469DRAFT_318302 [Zopfia rhizophila CBS 207.26]|uniref:Uncharacterized protein n=1 Tax=Zopfia rhizophila CBS 207.26 TaxID=1314779 RepID=A0A6A6EPX2_9PEZI|nr:hypothetical protein K469DRAFT_318302 [Zopfia rhizophila CBS 207.26]